MYLKWNEQTITDFSFPQIEALYQQGYLFGREKKGGLYQTRSLRIDLSRFEPNSENRRILRKTEELKIQLAPLPYSDYHWSIGKLAKDFYTTKFGEGVFSANKVKEILTEPTKNNFNTLLIYSIQDKPLGYAIVYESPNILHYSYPFYDLVESPDNMGMGMMLKAIVLAKDTGKKFIYLGGATRPSDVYKFQFAGMEWFDSQTWNTDREKLGAIFKETK